MANKYLSIISNEYKELFIYIGMEIIYISLYENAINTILV